MSPFRLPPLRGLPLATLHAGELLRLREPRVVSTLLGSCVAVTMCHPRAGLSAICHAQFPEDPGSSPERRFFYADAAIRAMISFFRESGIRWSEVEIKLFGGADVLEEVDLSRLGSVGEMNVNAALGTLAEEGLSPSVSDVRGKLGRRLFFFTDTGEVLLRRLRKHKVICR